MLFTQEKDGTTGINMKTRAALPMAMVQHVRLSGGDSYNENGCLKVQYCPGSNLRASLAAISSANSKVSPGLSPINSLFKVGLDNPFPPTCQHRCQQCRRQGWIREHSPTAASTQAQICPSTPRLSSALSLGSGHSRAHSNPAFT